MNAIKKVYHYYAPNWLKRVYRRKICNAKNIDYSVLNSSYADKECEYIKKVRMLEAIPYEWKREYHAGNYKVHKDNKGYFCVVGGSKKLYFPEKEGVSANASELLEALMIEQDARNPHHYFSPNVHINEGDIMFDVGAAEGLIALLNIEKVKKVYLFECNPEWIESLMKTFEPWQRKVEIVNKYVSDINDETHTTLEPYIRRHTSDNILIKMDIEGMETKVISGGMGDYLKKDNLKFSCCTYHTEKDAQVLECLFRDKGYSTEFSDGYMVWHEEPYFRKGIIRAYRSSSEQVMRGI